MISKYRHLIYETVPVTTVAPYSIACVKHDPCDLTWHCRARAIELSYGTSSHPPKSLRLL